MHGPSSTLGKRGYRILLRCGLGMTVKPEMGTASLVLKKLTPPIRLIVQLNETVTYTIPSDSPPAAFKLRSIKCHG